LTVRSNLDGISHHYYTLPTGEWPVKGKATGFPEQEWISRYSIRCIDEYLSLNEAVSTSTTRGEVGLYLDEWGLQRPGARPGGRLSVPAEFAARRLVAALNFNIFHRHAKRLHGQYRRRP
jgi:alpha-N-arabinofuranosidase